ncbi:MAG: hypothetical protein KBD46_01745, partial [Candidatus Levybacteria bacterium]|nr:hypothetical protein [Candidatus Levybacteria bacterium]
MSKHERQEAKRERRAAARQAETLTGGELFSRALEAEHAPDIFLVHQGMRHEELNLEGPAIIGESLQRNLSRAKGKRIVVLENAGGTKEQVDQLHETIDKIGFQGIVVLELIGAETQRAVSPSQIKERIKQIAYTRKVSDVLRQRLLPVSDVWRFYMGRELDKARSRWPFEVVHEYHTPDFNEKEKTAGEGGNVSEQVRALWENGEFDHALGLYIP